MPLAPPLLLRTCPGQSLEWERKLLQERRGWFLLTRPGMRLGLFYVALRGTGYALCLTEPARQVLELRVTPTLHSSWLQVRSAVETHLGANLDNLQVHSLEVQVQSLEAACVRVFVSGASEVALRPRKQRRKDKFLLEDSDTDASLLEEPELQGFDVESLESDVGSEAEAGLEEPDPVDDPSPAQHIPEDDSEEELPDALPRASHVVPEYSNFFWTMENYWKARRLFEKSF